MDVSKSILTCYQQILTLSNRMLALAEQADWVRLIELEQEYVSTVSKLPVVTEKSPINITAFEQQQVKDCLQKILDNESTISQLLQVRMNELKGLISQSTRQKSVNAEYHKFADNKSMLPGGGSSK